MLFSLVYVFVFLDLLRSWEGAYEGLACRSDLLLIDLDIILDKSCKLKFVDFFFV